MKIGLRTSGHLLIGVVRIYSRKAKYLLADCSDALVKIKLAFRPGQTDMPVEGLEATVKAITLIEDFTSFDAELPDPSNIDVVDHFTRNQSRTEEITLKEDFGSGFLNLADFGDDSQSHQTGLLDMNFQGLAGHGDAFGDEDKGFDLLDADRVEVETPAKSETTLLANEEMAFALEPVAATPNSEKKSRKRKRRLVVDHNKELTDESIRDQLNDYSDLVGPFNMAPPTLQLMQWKESGGVDKLFAQTCLSVVTPQIKEVANPRNVYHRNIESINSGRLSALLSLQLFVKSVFRLKYSSMCGEVEEMRQDGQEVQRNMSALTTDDVSVVDSSVDPEKTHNETSLPFDHTWDDRSDHYELSQSVLNSQDFEDRRITRHAQKLLHGLKIHAQRNSDTTFSLEALCKGATRSQAAATFFSLLVLKKQRALDLHQRAPYEDILATPGPKFYD
ncbi:Double-strand-break repair protein rad21-like protein 1 [Collichthys lucidus]|uniref:Double-strand-break repair protein rad21-like protein 1 n=1 Tax=Collichthys lucidus TaxID=240159 RepID=A0A4U5UPU8_COLLU|nr:Double-strand-break repair protein rad21-like protein 1 [Collichthys lucidus]